MTARINSYRGFALDFNDYSDSSKAVAQMERMMAVESVLCTDSETRSCAAHRFCSAGHTNSGIALTEGFTPDTTSREDVLDFQLLNYQVAQLPKSPDGTRCLDHNRKKMLIMSAQRFKFLQPRNPFRYRYRLLSRMPYMDCGARPAGACAIQNPRKNRL